MRYTERVNLKLDGDIPAAQRLIPLARKILWQLYNRNHELGILGPEGQSVHNYKAEDGSEIRVWWNPWEPMIRIVGRTADGRVVDFRLPLELLSEVIIQDEVVALFRRLLSEVIIQDEVVVDFRLPLELLSEVIIQDEVVALFRQLLHGIVFVSRRLPISAQDTNLGRRIYWQGGQWQVVGPWSSGTQVVGSWVSSDLQTAVTWSSLGVFIDGQRSSSAEYTPFAFVRHGGGFVYAARLGSSIQVYELESGSDTLLRVVDSGFGFPTHHPQLTDDGVWDFAVLHYSSSSVIFNYRWYISSKLDIFTGEYDYESVYFGGDAWYTISYVVDCTTKDYTLCDHPETAVLQQETSRTVTWTDSGTIDFPLFEDHTPGGWQLRAYVSKQRNIHAHHVFDPSPAPDFCHNTYSLGESTVSWESFTEFTIPGIGLILRTRHHSVTSATSGAAWGQCLLAKRYSRRATVLVDPANRDYLALVVTMYCVVPDTEWEPPSLDVLSFEPPTVVCPPDGSPQNIYPEFAVQSQYVYSRSSGTLSFFSGGFSYFGCCYGVEPSNYALVWGPFPLSQTPRSSSIQYVGGGGDAPIPKSISESSFMTESSYSVENFLSRDVNVRLVRHPRDRSGRSLVGFYESDGGAFLDDGSFSDIVGGSASILDAYRR